jgi:hypothetical protein
LPHPHHPEPHATVAKVTKVSKKISSFPSQTPSEAQRGLPRPSEGGLASLPRPASGLRVSKLRLPHLPRNVQPDEQPIRTGDHHLLF